MTRCRREEELDWVAVRLLRAGKSPGDARSLPDELQDLAPLLRHAVECVRCGEILGLLYETERARRPAATAIGASTDGVLVDPGPRVLTLIPLVGLPGGAEPSDEAAQEAAAEYPVAADSRRARPAKGAHEAASLVLTLTTRDQRYVVRIFPNQDGDGATAVLLGAETKSGKLPSGTPPSGVSLRVGEVEYPFDEKGYARLAGFPVGRIALVVE